MLTQILLIVTGIVLFLFGLIRLSEGMQRVLSVRIRRYIKQTAKKPIFGIALGAAVTAIFQSSATTAVIAVGMVNAGLLTLFSSLGLLLGASIGTTITAQLVALKITAIAPVFIVIGIVLWFLAKNDKRKIVGETVFYFGLLFFGLSLVGQAIGPLKQSPAFASLIQGARNPFWGILLGFIFTAITQSSSVTTGILVLLGQQGLITLDSGLPLILGANIGSTIPVLFASLCLSKNAKRAAVSHFLFKFIGVGLILPFIGPFALLVKNLTPSIAQQVVSAHFLFSIFVVIIFYFLLKPFTLLLKKLIPGEEKIIPLWPEYLDKQYLAEPGRALSGVRKEMRRGILLGQKMFFDAVEIIFKFKNSIMQRVTYTELVVDNLQAEVMRFLEKIPKEKLTRPQADKLIHYSAIMDKIERIADQITNLAKLARHKERNKVKFSDEALGEIRELEDLLAESLEDTISLLEEKDGQRMKHIFERESIVDRKVEQAKEKHFERFYRKARLAADGPLLNDILINFERISDHCEDIAKYIEQIQQYEDESLTQQA